MIRAALFFLGIALYGQDQKWIEADRQVVRLKPSAFPELPPNLAADLDRRGCTIPQVPMITRRHNVIKGEFARPGQIDWAVLCSRNRVSTILVYWNGSETSPAEIEKRNDADHLQGWTEGKIVYSRMIMPMGASKIMEHYNAYGGPKPPSIDHLGVDDAFFGKASVTYYFHHGKWLRLTGAD